MGWLKRFPSYDQIIHSAAETFKRFPFTMLCAWFGMVVAILMIDDHNSIHIPLLTRLLMTAGLGLPLLMTLAAFAERLKWPQLHSRLLQAGGVVLLVLYYFSLPADVTEPMAPAIRFALLGIGLLFMAAFLPFLQKGATDAFWQYNKALFLRYLMAALYASVMYVGLVIALAAADHLFGLDVKPERYGQLWMLIVGLFFTWVFLSGVPHPLSELRDAGEYPKGLKVFAQFILLPLVGLYFIILISYELKIIFEWNWPKGWVSQLVLWYSVVGILSMLLLYPLRLREENKWINRFGTWYFRLMVPLTVLLFLAIITRVKDYGITEMRYFVLALAIGLSVVVLYFIFSRKRDIRIIPIVVCALAFLSTFGPWGAFAVSQNSQLGRLETMLAANGLMNDGALAQRTEGKELPHEIRREMSNIITYLHTWHGTEAFAALLPDSALEEVREEPYYARPAEVARLVGFEPVDQVQLGPGGQYFSLHADKRRTFAVDGYDYLFEYQYLGTLDSGNAYALGEDSLYADVSPVRGELDLRVNSPDGLVDSLSLSFLDPIIAVTADTLHRNELPADQTTFDIAGERYEARVIMRDMTGYRRPDGININSTALLILLRRYAP